MRFTLVVLRLAALLAVALVAVLTEVLAVAGLLDGAVAVPAVAAAVARAEVDFALGLALLVLGGVFAVRGGEGGS